ncbi:hypothetical protein LCGC14_1971430, partial [marine sediment metagenome]
MFITGQFIPATILDGLFIDIISGGIGFGYDNRYYFLTPFVIRQTDTGAVEHTFMTSDDLLDLIVVEQQGSDDRAEVSRYSGDSDAHRTTLASALALATR